MMIVYHRPKRSNNNWNLRVISRDGLFLTLFFWSYSSFLQNPYFFMYASLVAPDTNEELHLLRDGKTRSTTGSVVSSLYHLKDVDNSDAGFFVFPDLSVRMEGTYRLKLSLFEIVAREVFHCKSIFSEVFVVYSAKRFPGMEESTFLSRSFADQGLKIRIRKEIRIRRRLVKRKELDQLEDTDGNRMKRPRGDGKYDDDSHESSETEITDRARSIDESRSRRSPESLDRRRDHGRKTPPSSRHRGPYDPYGHYDHNAAIYGHGYPMHRPLPWHDRPEYMGDPHYSPYYDPYDRRYGYHPYYYPPPLPDGSDHHRYPYPPPPAYGRPPMYPGQPGYYDPPPRIPHPSGESSGAVRPYGYDPSNPYSPRPWPHYADRTPTNHNTESLSSPYRGSGPPPVPLHGPPMYPYPDYYPVYPPPPMGPLHPPPKQDYGPNDPASSQHGQNPSKIPIQDLLSTEQHQSQSNVERGVANVPPPRMYGAPPSAFAHFYPHPGRPHEYPPRHDLYGHPRYQHEIGYPSHESYSQSIASSSTGSKAGHPPAVSQSQDSARSSTITSTQTTMPSSSYNSGPIVPAASRPAVSLPSLAPINVSDRYANSSSSIQAHPSYPTSTTSQQKSPKQSTSQQHSPYEQPKLPYSQSSLNSNRMSFSPIAESSNGKNKNITDCSSMNNDNEDSNSLSSVLSDLEESRRQDDDIDD
ncbi:velvet factor-domain-containing protein [Gigaspora margarita]|uniref:Velvet factor-domain-containing protein n=1 Tax=Gigaspora margarita TaxID=4874 RepID=A0A8H3WZ71_GIGMA|nr:velvet factor-domain-containing protein [Gigaspora margarita]